MGAVKDAMANLVADIRTGLATRNDVPDWAHCEQIESVFQELELTREGPRIHDQEST